MEIQENRLNNFSKKELVRWGLFQQVCKERLIDQLLTDSPEPIPPLKEDLQKRWCLEKNISSQKALSRWLQHNEIDYEDWQSLTIRKWCWLQWCKNRFHNEISHYYLKRKKKLDKVTYSLLRVKKRNLANELYLRIKEKEASFEEIATSYSEGQDRSKRSLIGPVEFSKLPFEIAKILESGIPGQLWSPKQFGPWWIIVRLENFQPTSLNERTSIRLALELGEKYLLNAIDKSRSNIVSSENVT